MADLTVKTDGEKVLLKDGRGSIAFVVSNESDRDVTAEPSLVPLGETQADWLRLADGAQGANGGDVVLPPQGDHAFTVQVAPPSGAPASSYRFRFRVVDKYEPGAHWGESPEISFDVAAPPPREKPRPRWWPYVVAAAVLLIAIGAAVWLLTRKTTVPVLAGETPESAQAILAKASLKAGNQTQAGDKDMAPGKIIRTVPEAGKKVARGSAVDLVVSGLGEASAFIGEWVNEEANVALPVAFRIRFESGNLVFQRLPDPSDNSPPTGLTPVAEVKGGRVSFRATSQITIGPKVSFVENVLTLESQPDGRLLATYVVDPANAAAGTPPLAASPQFFMVRDPVQVPALTTQAAAGAALIAGHLKLGKVTAGAVAGKAPGAVTSSNPVAGRWVARDTPVDIQVASPASRFVGRWARADGPPSPDTLDFTSEPLTISNSSNQISASGVLAGSSLTAAGPEPGAGQDSVTLSGALPGLHGFPGGLWSDLDLACVLKAQPDGSLQFNTTVRARGGIPIGAPLSRQYAGTLRRQN